MGGASVGSLGDDGSLGLRSTREWRQTSIESNESLAPSHAREEAEGEAGENPQLQSLSGQAVPPLLGGPFGAGAGVAAPAPGPGPAQPKPSDLSSEEGAHEKAELDIAMLSSTAVPCTPAPLSPF